MFPMCFTTLDTFDTEFSADSVEWCPIEPFTDVFVCGTYQFSNTEVGGDTENTKCPNRLGRIYLFRVKNSGKLNLLQHLNVPAVLDMKWMHVKMNHKILLGVANASGCIQIYELSDVNNISLKLFTEQKINPDHGEILALSLDWSSGVLCNNADQDVKAVVSDSHGSISIFEFRGESLVNKYLWNAHGYEAWIAAFDYWNTNIIYTGGDDCRLQWFDIRMGTQPAGNNRIHGAGVTSLHSNAAQEFTLASGSYDEILRLWDVRKLRNPVSELNLNGGIWRLKWEPKHHTCLLAACMYGGFKIIDCLDKGAPNVIAQYTEHESISYGSDWSSLSSSEIKRLGIADCTIDTRVLIGTCSFYDHTLKLSSVDLNKQE
ncbi:diphthine methyltransferase [Neodiprion lecontei]|uniref:methylated diphthine methylhydrolase n=1 Tax=Neodiprion lecontei TaxID=441921 RepID=A0ABM3FSF8_NEOLC|nr:diphthine methyltransferase [Neodiprion fabricii]XP_046417592.1 diphthine methyltransferase [Neodiprion fabricii]XP_046590942.1 diphthine methyltransferase [Neodiprion lecontei]XP_046590943.1 diphthine methyltransferase [Neodiprion lecontei]